MKLNPLLLNKLASRIERLKNIYLYLNERNGSFPYISGDSFMLLCDFKIFSFNDLLIFSNCESELHKIVYLDCSFLYSNNNKLDVIINLLAVRNSKNVTLIIHNGDYIADINFYSHLSSLFNKIFMVNLSHDAIDNVIGIPIGLENIHYLKNGFTSIFKTESSFKKTNLVYSSFRSHTNQNIRLKVKRICEESEYGFAGHNFSFNENIMNMKNSYFTISPPGNGPDCHRTWEAIYSRSIPVILKSTLSEKLTQNLPIHVVDCYSEFLSLKSSTLIDLYWHINNNSNTRKAFLPYWINQITAGQQ